MSQLIGVFDLSFYATFARCLGFFLLLPFDSVGKGALSKLLLSFICAVFLKVTLLSGSQYQGSIWMEPVVGLLLALPLVAVLEIASALGELIDQGRGQTIGSFYDPGLGMPQSALSRLFRWCLWALLLQSGIAELSIGYLGASITQVPTSAMNASVFSQLAIGSLQFLVELLGLGFSIYIPFAIIFLMVDYSIGVLGKVAPQISLQAEAFQLKTFFATSSLLALISLNPVLGAEVAAPAYRYLSLLGSYMLNTGA